MSGPRGGPGGHFCSPLLHSSGAGDLTRVPAGHPGGRQREPHLRAGESMRRGVPASVAAWEDGHVQESVELLVLQSEGAGHPRPAPLWCRHRAFHPSPGAHSVSRLAFKGRGKTLVGGVGPRVTSTKSSSAQRRIMVVSTSPGTHSNEYPLQCCL